MKVEILTIVEHKIKRRGVEVMYRDHQNWDGKTVWISTGGSTNGVYGWYTPKEAMNLAKAIIKLRSDLKKAGIKI